MKMCVITAFFARALQTCLDRLYSCALFSQMGWSIYAVPRQPLCQEEGASVKTASLAGELYRGHLCALVLVMAKRLPFLHQAPWRLQTSLALTRGSGHSTGAGPPAYARRTHTARARSRCAG